MSIYYKFQWRNWNKLLGRNMSASSSGRIFNIFSGRLIFLLREAIKVKTSGIFHTLEWKVVKKMQTLNFLWCPDIALSSLSLVNIVCWQCGAEKMSRWWMFPSLEKLNILFITNHRLPIHTSSSEVEYVILFSDRDHKKHRGREIYCCTADLLKYISTHKILVSSHSQHRAQLAS